MSIMDSITKTGKDYWNDVPNNTLEQAGKAFIKGFAFSYVSSGMHSLNIKPGLMIGTLWGTATALHGLLYPAFKGLEGKVGISVSFGGPFYEIGRGALALWGACLLSRRTTGYRGPDLKSQIIMMAINIIVDSNHYGSGWGQPQKKETRQLGAHNIQFSGKV